jgi:N-acetylglucosamine-6-phosphate deacetylase
MIESIRNLVQLGASLQAALSAATEVPARIVGRGDVGRLGPGARADLVVVDDNIEIVRVVAGGKEAI